MATIFTAIGAGRGNELWVSYGTAAGTVLFKDINPGAGGSLPGPWTSVNGLAVFVADDGSHGRNCG